MHRYWLAAVCIMFMLSSSACNKKEGMLPKTDGSQASQTSNPNASRDDAAAAGKAAPGQR